MQYFIPILLILFSFTSLPSYATIPLEEIRESLGERITKASQGSLKLYSAKGQIYSEITLTELYKSNDYNPVWIDHQGLKPIAEDMVVAIKQSRMEGLYPQDYHLAFIENLRKEIEETELQFGYADQEKLVDLELLLTDSFLLLGSHYLEGKVNPETLNINWNVGRRQADLNSLLLEAIVNQTIIQTMQSLLPNYPEYIDLRTALAMYRDISDKGGWLTIPPGPSMRNGEEDERVPMLRKRLEITRDYKGTGHIQSNFFDDELEDSVTHFQKRHGLETDGIVGPLTLAELNIPVEHRIEQIILNMERWRWLPNSLGERYFIVNIANFEVRIIENDLTVLEMRAVVGRQYRKTPVFSSSMTHLVFSPYWNVPYSIMVKDIIPEVKKDIRYLSRKNIKILSGWGTETKAINPYSINWSGVTGRNFPYRLRQQPGPDNALGQVKFMFPNKFNVYMHDTPDRELFEKPKRSFSSGCIRIDKPIELTNYLLSDQPEWTIEAIFDAMNNKKQRYVNLKKPVPVHILYWTAWVSKDDSIQFREDIYGRDDELFEVFYSPSTEFTEISN